MPRSTHFTHAICRMPAKTVTDGLRAVDTGTPDFDLFRAHHASYVAALQSTGAQILLLPALPAYPDSVFVEDAALCLPEGAIIMRPGAPSRLGEAAEIATTLTSLYRDVRRIEPPGFIEGGDILVTEREILVGTSARTDEAGIDALRQLTSDWGYVVRKVETPPGVLHFKTDCSLLGPETILSTRRLAGTGCFAGYDVIEVADGEEACANSIRFNDIVIMPDGFPETARRVRDAGFSVHPVPNTEAAKLDGGVSCMSLRFSLPAD